MVRVQEPWLWLAQATTPRTACSARVNLAARGGGSQPEEAHPRLLSMDAPDLGPEPPRLCAGFLGAGMAPLASMVGDRAEAWASLTGRAATAFQNRALIFVSSRRGVASTARRSCSTNITSPPGQRPAG